MIANMKPPLAHQLLSLAVGQKGVDQAIALNREKHLVDEMLRRAASNLPGPQLERTVFMSESEIAGSGRRSRSPSGWRLGAAATIAPTFEIPIGQPVNLRADAEETELSISK
jgi:hypothetical protein